MRHTEDYGKLKDYMMQYQTDIGQLLTYLTKKHSKERDFIETSFFLNMVNMSYSWKRLVYSNYDSNAYL